MLTIWKQGRRFQQVVYQVRVKQAKALLTTGMPIAEVAGETGFADQSHLTRHFKRIVGLTPGQFMRDSVQDGSPAQPYTEGVTAHLPGCMLPAM